MSVCVSVCPMFHHVLTSPADILDSGWGHIFKKYRHKNNKKVTHIYAKTVKNWLLLGSLPTGCYVDEECVHI